VSSEVRTNAHTSESSALVIPGQEVGGRVHFAVCIYHHVKPLRGEGKDMVPERPFPSSSC